ncbi:GNAT family N-acetyltransferase, partial [Phocaeicola vulgatus]
VYANFKSIYADECIRGMQIVDDLFEKSIEYARECKAAYIVGKVHAGNVPMRSLYKKHCFEPTHVTMERKLL